MKRYSKFFFMLRFTKSANLVLVLLDAQSNKCTSVRRNDVEQ